MHVFGPRLRVPESGCFDRIDADTLIRWFIGMNRPHLETVCLQMPDVIGHLRNSINDEQSC